MKTEKQIKEEKRLIRQLLLQEIYDLFEEYQEEFSKESIPEWLSALGNKGIALQELTERLGFDWREVMDCRIYPHTVKILTVKGLLK